MLNQTPDQKPSNTSDNIFKYIKNAFFILIILQIAPAILQNLKKAIAESISPKTQVGYLVLQGVMSDASFYERHIQKFAKNPDIKGLIIKINSPGGFPGTGQSIFNEIKKFKEKKPVVVTVENLCASAAYYAASASNHIVAAPSAMVGSIGVLCQLPNVKDLINSWKISVEHIQSGEYKTAGSPVKELQEKEVIYLQDISDNAYQQFIQDVSTVRNLQLNDHTIWANGKVFTGTQALELKLVDSIGSFYDGVDHMKKLLNLEKDEEIKLTRPKKPSGLLAMFGNESENDIETRMSLAEKSALFLHKTYSTFIQLQHQTTPSLS